MKLRNTREVYWLEASDSATIVTEKTTPATVIIDPAIAESMPREPAAPAPNRRGHVASTSRLTSISISTSSSASNTATRTTSAGSAQNRSRIAAHRFSSFLIMRAASGDSRRSNLPTPINHATRNASPAALKLSSAPILVSANAAPAGNAAVAKNSDTVKPIAAITPTTTRSEVLSPAGKSRARQARHPGEEHDAERLADQQAGEHEVSARSDIGQRDAGVGQSERTAARTGPASPTSARTDSACRHVGPPADRTAPGPASCAA